LEALHDRRLAWPNLLAQGHEEGPGMRRGAGWVVIGSVVSAVGALAVPTASAAPEEPFGCRGAEVSGLPAADAATATDIVCRELASVSGSSGRFVVSFRPLGSSLVLTVSREDTSEGRSLVLDGFREVPIAARRLAEALVRDRAVEATQEVDTLVESEARPILSRPGGRKFEMGAFGLAAGRGTPLGAGFAIGLAYDAPAFAIPAQMRFGSASDGEREITFFSIDTGGRYYFSRGAVSPFVGGGFSVLRLSNSENSYGAIGDGSYYSTRYVQDSRWGAGLYVEVGVQLFRLHRGRMTAFVRADLPTYRLHPTGADYGERGRVVSIDGGRRYIVPVTFGLTGSF
jgi:hypothetical protein